MIIGVLFAASILGAVEGSYQMTSVLEKKRKNWKRRGAVKKLTSQSSRSNQESPTTQQAPKQEEVKKNLHRPKSAPKTTAPNSAAKIDPQQDAQERASTRKDPSFDSIVAVDFETTGVTWPYHAVEIAWVILDQSLNEISRSTSLIRPPIQIPPQASQIHGITDADVSDCPTLDEFILEESGNPFDGHHIWFVGHNAPYDFRLFRPYCASARLGCTLSASRRAFRNLSNHKLSTIARHLNHRNTDEHRALSDVLTAIAVLRGIRERERLNFVQLVDYCDPASAVGRMPFGKHKGLNLDEIPTDYLKWLGSRLEDDDVLGVAVRRILANREE